MTALWGARNVGQLDEVKQAFGWKLSRDDYAEVDRILRETIENRVGPVFMAPPRATRWRCKCRSSSPVLGKRAPVRWPVKAPSSSSPHVARNASTH